MFASRGLLIGALATALSMLPQFARAQQACWLCDPDYHRCAVTTGNGSKGCQNWPGGEGCTTSGSCSVTIRDFAPDGTFLADVKAQPSVGSVVPAPEYGVVFVRACNGMVVKRTYAPEVAAERRAVTDLITI